MKNVPKSPKESARLWAEKAKASKEIQMLLIEKETLNDLDLELQCLRQIASAMPKEMTF